MFMKQSTCFQNIMPVSLELFLAGGGGGAHLTSNVALDFRVLGRIRDLKTYIPPKFRFLSVLGHIML